MTTKSSLFRISIPRAGRLAPRPSRRSRNQSGMALLTTLLLLILVSVLGLAMAVTTNSDMMINSYYGSYRGSFYAADSGLNIARAQLVNLLSAQVNLTPCTGWETGAPAPGCTSAPLVGVSAASSALSSIKSNYGSFTSLNAGQASNSWPGRFIVADVTGCTNSVQVVSGGATHQNAQLQNDQYSYTFSYTLCTVGRAQAVQQVATKETGSVIINIQAQTAGSQQVIASFAAFGGFIDHFSTCQGALVAGTMTGPFFTNGSWNFGTGGSYIFTDPVGQASANADYIFPSGFGAPSCSGVSGCDCKNASSDTYNHQTIAPTFQAGFNRSQPVVALPANDFSQQWAVIDGKGCGEGGTTCGSGSPPAPTHADLNANLKNVSGTSYPVGGATSGVYIPYCTGGAGCTTPNTFLGGGFYIEDNGSIATNIQTSLGTDGATPPNPTQIYTITQGATTTTITLNINANTTKVVSGGNTLNLTGVPRNLTGSTPQEGAMIYVNGTISSLSGPGQNTASLQDYYATTIAANGNVNVTGDLIYKHEPVTLNNSDTLVSGNDFNQVLGIFTTNGDIVWSSSYANKNLEIDASMAAINSSCTAGSSQSICGFATSGHVNTLTIVGGRIESNAHSVNLNTSNTYFDRRFTSRAGFAPPWFPSTSLPQEDIVGAIAPLVTATQPQRLTWVTWPQ